MSIETSVRKEITEYKEKVIFGLSIRQLICTVIAIAVGILVYLLASLKLKISVQNTGYLIMAAVVPAFAIGFISPGGFKFEVYAKMVVKSYLIRAKYLYGTNVRELPDKDKRRGERKNELKPIPKAVRKKGSFAEPSSESFRSKTTKKDTERKRKEAARKAKAASRKFIKEEQKALRRAEKRSRS